MKAYCGNCGKAVDPYAERCVYCRADLRKNRRVEDNDDWTFDDVLRKLGFIWAFYGFIFPGAGFFTYLYAHLNNESRIADKPLIIGVMAYVAVFVLGNAALWIFELGDFTFVTGETFIRDLLKYHSRIS